MNFELNDDDVIMRDILKLAFGGDCEVVFPKLDTNQVLSRTILAAIIMTLVMIRALDGDDDHNDDDDHDDHDDDVDENPNNDDDLTSLIVCVGSTSTSLGAVSMLSEISVLIAIRI